MPIKIFQKWGLDFIKPIGPPARCTKIRYIITVTYCTTKWIEARALKDSSTKSTKKIKKLEVLITKFACPLEFMSCQRNHYINDTIKVFTQNFMILHQKSTTYYTLTLIMSHPPFHQKV